MESVSHSLSAGSLRGLHRLSLPAGQCETHYSGSRFDPQAGIRNQITGNGQPKRIYFGTMLRPRGPSAFPGAPTRHGSAFDMTRGPVRLAVAVLLGALCAGLQAPPLKSPAATPGVEGTVVKYSKRSGDLVLRVEGHRQRLSVDRDVVLTAAGRRARPEWLTAGVPVRVTMVEQGSKTRRGWPWQRRAARSRGRPVVASIELLTERATGWLRSASHKRQLRVSRYRLPTSQPVSPTTQPAARRRPRTLPSLTFSPVRQTRFHRQGTKVSRSSVVKGDLVEVTYIPGARYPIALDINVVKAARGGDGSKVRIRSDIAGQPSSAGRSGGSREPK